MKTTPLAISLFSAAAFAVTIGCKPADSNPPGPTSELERETARQYEQAKQETKEAIEATKDYAYAQRAEYAAKTKEKLAALNRELDELGTKIESSSSTAKAEAKVKLEQLRAQVAKLGEKLDGVPEATESTWEEVKSGIKKGYDEVEQSFKQARDWLSEKLS